MKNKIQEIFFAKNGVAIMDHPPRDCDKIRLILCVKNF